MGVIFAGKQTFVDLSSFGFMESIGILSMVIVGGMGNIAGIIIGAVGVVMLQLNILKELSEYLGQLAAQGILHIPSLLGFKSNNELPPLTFQVILKHFVYL